MNINFIGDIYLKNKVEIDNRLNLRNVVLNLEAPFSDKGDPAKNKINLYMNEKNLFDTFAENNIIAINLANNHIMDYGEDAFVTTLEILNKKNISYFGAGKKSNNYNNPFIIKNEIALFGYACSTTHAVFGDDKKAGPAMLEMDQVIYQIKKYIGKYFIIVSIHWGQEYFSFPKPDDVSKARKLIDAGADLIIGHHPHKIQSYEIYNSKHIYYSIGNGIFHDDIVVCRFDGTRFTDKHRLKYKKKYRKSILVKLDKESKIATHEFIIYDDINLKPAPKNVFLNFKLRLILNNFFYNVYKHIKFFQFRVVYHCNNFARKRL